MDDLVVAAQGDKLIEPTHERELHPLAAEEWLASRVLECITDPRLVCRFALINKNFSAASVSDLVWQKLLPPSAILDPLLAHVMNYKPLSKKHLYFYLCCNPITYDNGLKKFWLDPATGGECHMISAKALTVVWGSSPQYWEWKPYPGSMFSEVAHLRAVCWFDVSGTFQHLFRPGKYTISFRLQLHSADEGWRGVPVKLCVQNTTYAHPPHESQVFFDSPPFKLRSCPLSNMFAASPKQATLNSESLIDPCNATSSKRDGESGGKNQGAIEENENHMQGKSLTYPSNGMSTKSGQQLSSFSKRFRGFVTGSRDVKPMKPQIPFNKQQGSCSRAADNKTTDESSDCVQSICKIEIPIWKRLGSYSRAYDNDNMNEAYEAQDNINASSNKDPHVWVECDVGEFFVEEDSANRPIEVHFSMTEIKVGRWKGGLFLDGAIIRPSYVIDHIAGKE